MNVQEPTSPQSPSGSKEQSPGKIPPQSIRVSGKDYVTSFVERVVLK